MEREEDGEREKIREKGEITDCYQILCLYTREKEGRRQEGEDRQEDGHKWKERRGRKVIREGKRMDTNGKREEEEKTDKKNETD